SSIPYPCSVLDPPTPAPPPLSLHDALPIYAERLGQAARPGGEQPYVRRPAPLAHQVEPLRRLERADQHGARLAFVAAHEVEAPVDRKSTRLNSSHLVISYAVFCLKKKKKIC